jgi:hypothetical protein
MPNYTDCLISDTGLNVCYNKPCQYDSDCTVLGKDVCNQDLHECLSLECKNDDYCLSLKIQYPENVFYSKCDLGNKIDSTKSLCYNSPCITDTDCKPSGSNLTTCNPSSGNCYYGNCSSDIECKNADFTNCDLTKHKCYNSPCKVNSDCEYEGALACDPYSQVCFNNTCNSIYDCWNYYYTYNTLYSGCDYDKEVCYTCKSNADCQHNHNMDTCLLKYGTCFNNTCQSDYDCFYPGYTNCNLNTNTCFETSCQEDKDCAKYHLNACDPRYKVCYNYTTERYCLEDDDCGPLGLLAACDNQNEICVLPNPNDTSSQLYFLSSFNLYKGIVMTATYNPSLDIPEDGNLKFLIYFQPQLIPFSLIQRFLLVKHFHCMEKSKYVMIRFLIGRVIFRKVLFKN